MNAKDQFIANRDLCSYWGVISNDSKFDQVLLYASGITLEGMASAEQREGVLRFKEILLTMAIPDAAPVKFVQTGLHHNLDAHRRIADLTHKPEPSPAPAPKLKTKK